MNWSKINLQSIIILFREFEEKSITIDDEYSVIYSDGDDELKISYKKLK